VPPPTHRPIVGENASSIGPAKGAQADTGL